jgi:hypothetical protein
MKLAEAWDVRMRAEKKGITGEEGNDSKGWLYFIDLLFKPMMGKFSGNCRLLFHYSDQYRSGIYAFENDAGGLVGVRSFSGKGWSTYINVRYKIDQGTSVWLRISWSRSASVDSPSIFSFSREIRLQGLFTF